MNLTYGNTLVQQSVDDYLKQCQLKKVQNYHISSYSTYEFVNVECRPKAHRASLLHHQHQGLGVSDGTGPRLDSGVRGEGEEYMAAKTSWVAGSTAEGGQSVIRSVASLTMRSRCGAASPATTTLSSPARRLVYSWELTPEAPTTITAVTIISPLISAQLDAMSRLSWSQSQFSRL